MSEEITLEGENETTITTPPPPPIPAPIVKRKKKASKQKQKSQSPPPTPQSPYVPITFCANFSDGEEKRGILSEIFLATTGERELLTYILAKCSDDELKIIKSLTVSTTPLADDDKTSPRFNWMPSSIHVKTYTFQ